MQDNHYINPKLAELYDLDSGWCIDREFYLNLAAPERQQILDLGCGTGLICDAYAAKHHDVTGVDPSPSMLDVARRKPYGSRIEWIQSCAQTFQHEKQFDLIIMTGHAFQVLLEDEDVLQTFATMRKHLKHGGMVAFESRNPTIKWEDEWDYQMVLELPDNSKVTESRRLLTKEKDRMTFELRYQFPDETLTSISELRFCSRSDIEKALSFAGLRVEKILGDYDGSPFDDRASREMLFLVRHSAI